MIRIPSRRSRFTCAALACATLLSLRAAASSTDPVLDVSERFLSHIDAGEYQAAWELLHPNYQKLGPMAYWKANIEKKRTQLGSVVTREPSPIHDMTEEVPNMPQGTYLIVRFGSQYEKQDSVLEIVMLGFVEGMGWRVAGYGVR